MLLLSEEEFYDGLDTLKCKCKFRIKMKWNYASCCERCVLCRKCWRGTLVFDYWLFTPLLTNVCRNHKFRHDFLELWWRRESWLGKLVDYQPLAIFEFWDGNTLQKYQSFWDPNSFKELLVKCSNQRCSFRFKAFPHPCSKLFQVRGSMSKLYQFAYPTCSFLIESALQLQRVIF